MKINTCFIILMLLLGSVNAQPYKKLIAEYDGYAWQNYESYDKGLYILKPVDTVPRILKLDANGNKLWQRDIKSSKYYIAPTAMYPTDDGGVLLGGYSTLTDNTGSFFLMKLNACGEKEWCTDYDKGNYIGNAYVWELYKIGNNYIMGCQVMIGSGNYGSYFTFDSVGNIINQFHIWQHDAGYRYIRKVNNQFCFSYSSVSTYVYPNDTNALGLHSCNVGIDQNGNFAWINVVGIDSFSFAGQGLNAVDYRNGFGYGGGNCLAKATLTKLNNKGEISSINYLGHLKPYIYTNSIDALNYASDTTLIVAVEAIQILNFNPEYSTTIYLCDTGARVIDSLVFGDTGAMEKYRCLDILNTSDSNFLLIFQYKKGPGDSDFVYLQKINSKLQTVNFDATNRTYDWKCGHTVKSYDSLNIDDAKKAKIVYDSSKFIKYVHYPASINNITPIKYTVNLYPNPANDIINIDLSNFEYEKKNLTIELIDMVGKIIIQQRANANNSITTLNIQNIAAGAYNIVILSGSERLSWSKVVKH